LQLKFSIKPFVLFWLCLGFATSTGARTIMSTSRQFSVTGPENIFLPAERNNRVGLVTLEPELLAVSAERIKSALLAELYQPDRYQGNFQLFIRPVSPDVMPIGVVSTHYLDGWQYRVELPERVDGKRLLTSLVEVLLIEIANREQGDHAAELPSWLLYGLTEELAFAVGPSFIVQRNLAIGGATRRPGINTAKFTGPTVWQSATSDPMRSVREILRTNSPISFRELTSAGSDAFTSERSEVFAASAHLLIQELFRLDPPRVHFRGFIASLSRTWNWQTAFFANYQLWFSKPLDAEKWWALALLDFTGQQQAMNWDIGFTMQHLDALLLTVAEVRTGPTDLPHRTTLSIPDLVRTWRVAQQTDALRPKIAQLAALEIRSNPFAIELIHDYKTAIQTYLDKIQGKGASPGQRNDVQQRLRVAGIEFLQKIDALDAKRDNLSKMAASKVAAR